MARLPPHTNYQGIPAPATGLIVKYRPSADSKMHWQDEANTVWGHRRKSLAADKDVFVDQCGR